jgi:diadenosine tetraphosphatase ApaH/serine/threonine PP2A family protein phosphatase
MPGARAQPGCSAWVTSSGTAHSRTRFSTRSENSEGRKLYIRGNHDRVAIGPDNGEGFNNAARQAALWTRDHLSHENMAFLRQLPVGPIATDDGVLVCHGSPFDEDEYVFTEFDAHKIFHAYPHKMILFGHTHLPSFFEISHRGELAGFLVRQPTSFRLDPSSRYLINPGSVGQPRDRNPHAAYAVYDENRTTIHFYRVEYDIAKAQEPILDAGLPRILADRLAVGA